MSSTSEPTTSSVLPPAKAGTTVPTGLRTLSCGDLRKSHVGQKVSLMGWINVCRNLGGLVFLDLRDHYGITQVVVEPESPLFELASHLRSETVVQVKGTVVARRGAINGKMDTGEIEVVADELKVESPSEILPFPVVHNPKEEGEDTRLKYRFLDLRTSRMQRNIRFRSQVIHFLRNKMVDLGFMEFQTPILTSSSPEGARDFVVPSRTHPGQFYALPQAPQQFKQLLMCSGFDRYFQIAPCFRDEDARADRSPGEFYQLDIEMAFATQDDVFKTVEQVMIDTYEKFSTRPIESKPFPRIPYAVAMEKYGSDKPDLRYSLEWQDVRSLFKESAFGLFKAASVSSAMLKAVVVPKGGAQSRKAFDDADAQAKSIGLGGFPWLSFVGGEWKGSVSKPLSDHEKSALKDRLGIADGDAVFFLVGQTEASKAAELKLHNQSGKMRTWISDKFPIAKKDVWSFCWIVDFPFFEWNEDEGKIDFCHNPFSMPQGGLEALNSKEPLHVLAYQYDIVCNGVELSSGAIRNHRRDIMKRAFELAGYSEADISAKFPSLWNAFSYGAPPHGGIAPGVDRMIMLLLDEPNIREIIAFPLNQKAQDLLMNAPSQLSEKQLKDVHIKLSLPVRAASAH